MMVFSLKGNPITPCTKITCFQKIDRNFCTIHTSNILSYIKLQRSKRYLRKKHTETNLFFKSFINLIIKKSIFQETTSLLFLILFYFFATKNYYKCELNSIREACHTNRLFLFALLIPGCKTITSVFIYRFIRLFFFYEHI